MVDNFEGLLKGKWNRQDLRALASQIREQESLLRLKRRYLMDLPLSTKEQKWIEEILSPNDKILPESFLRKDDVSYEDVKTCIETAFGAHKCRKEPLSINEDVRITSSRDGLKEILLLLDSMTNKGLYSLVKILTGGMISFEKSNLSMKRTIKELLPEVISDKNGISKTKFKQVLQILQDPSSFSGNQMVCKTASGAYSEAAIKVLDGLGDFSSRAVSAMCRKLKGDTGYIPSMKPSKPREGRDVLITRLKKRCMKMLSNISEVDEPSERLAGALGVAGLTLKLMVNRPAVIDFRRFSPEIEALQNDIVKAIHLLSEEKKVSLIELKKVQNVMDPKSKLSARSLRMAVRNLLTDYLYECSDMGKVPDCLIETLDIINRRSQLPSRKKRSSSEVYSSPQELMKEVIEREVECVLAISAQAKEVVSNLLPEHAFDEEFAHAYIEDYEVSDDRYVSDDDEQVRGTSQHFEFHSDHLYSQEESIGETNLGEFNSPVSTNERDSCSHLSPIRKFNERLESMHVTRRDSDKTDAFLSPIGKLKVLDSQCMDRKEDPSRCSGELGIACSDSVKMTTKQNLSYQSHSPAKSSCYNGIKSEETTSCSPGAPGYDCPVEETDILGQRGKSINEYLEVQEACDATSMIAYRFVGLMLDNLANNEGLELYQGDRLYLHSYASVPECSEEDEHTLLTSKFSEMWKSVIQQ